MPLARQFDNNIGHSIYPIAVVAEATDQAVSSGTAIQDVGTRPSGDGIGQGIARAGEGPRSGKGQVLDAGTQTEGVQGGADQVRAFAVGLDQHIGRIGHQIGVIAQAADQRVDPCTAVQNVVARPAGDDIGQRITRARKTTAARERQVLEMIPERIGG